MNGRLSKEGRALDSARFAICDLHDDVGTIRKTIAGLRATHLAEPHHDALDAALVTMSEALETFHRAEGIAIAAFNKRVTP